MNRRMKKGFWISLVGWMLAAQLLAKRVERSTDPIPAKAAEIRAFFVKYERLLADEIAQLARL